MLAGAAGIVAIAAASCWRVQTMMLSRCSRQSPSPHAPLIVGSTRARTSLSGQPAWMHRATTVVSTECRLPGRPSVGVTASPSSARTAGVSKPP